MFPCLRPNSWPPSLRTIRIARKTVVLPAGDYALEGHSPVIVERKASWRELTANLMPGRGRNRFLSALDRLSDSCSYPVLALEDPGPSPEPDSADPSLLRDILLSLCIPRRISVYCFQTRTPGARRRMGEWIVSLLIAGAQLSEPTQCRISPPPPP